MSIRPVQQVRNLVPIKNVMISAYDKRFIEDFVIGLIETCPGVHFYSSGGTYAKLKEFLGDKTSCLTEVSEYTGQAEIEGGLVKTLHHKLFLGYLAEENCANHQEALVRENAVMIDLYIGNLYPFSDVIKKAGATIETARGNIDVGGPSALRAAAKNFLRVLTVTNPHRYSSILLILKETGGCSTFESRLNGAQKTFRLLSEYDTAITRYLYEISPEEALTAYELID